MSASPWKVVTRSGVHFALDVPTALVFAACIIGVAQLTRRRPMHGVAALLVLAPFDLARYVGPTSLTTVKAGLFGLLMGLALTRPNLGRLRITRARAIPIAFAAMLVATGLSAVHAQYLVPVVREALKYGEYLVLFIAASIIVRNDVDDRPLCWALQIAVVGVCCSALAEYVVGAHSGLFLRGQSQVIPRIAGALEGPNQLAGYLDVALPILLARALVYPNRIAFSIVGLGGITDILTISRSGIVSVAVAVLLVLMLLRPLSGAAWRFGAAGVAVAVGGVVVALRAGVPSGYFSIDPVIQPGDHLANRSQLWHAAIALWKSSPVVGIGAGNYEMDLSRVGLVGVRTHANSIYLQSLAEGGLIGLASTMSLIVTPLVILARSASRHPAVVGALGATIALAVHQVADDLFFFPKVMSAYWIFLGAAVAEIVRKPLVEEPHGHVVEAPFAKDAIL